MSIVKDSVLIELQSAVEKSKEYKKNIEEAKTNTKSAFFMRKLKKNNKKVAELIIGLDRIEKAQYNN